MIAQVRQRRDERPCLLHSLVELLGLGIQRRRVATAPGGRRRAAVALRDEKIVLFFRLLACGV